MSRWFRHYAGMMRDDKLVRVAIRAKQPIERVVWVYAAILESAAEIDEDGRYDFDTAEAAYFLRADETDVHAIVGELSAQGRIVGDCVVKWSDRQFSSDRSAERQRRDRERKTGGDAGVRGEEPPSERNADGEVTSLSQHGDAPERELETDTETDTLTARTTLADFRCAITTAYQAVRQTPPDTAYAGVWLAHGRDPEICIAVIRSLIAKKSNLPLKYFDGPIADAHAVPRGTAKSTGPPREAKRDPFLKNFQTKLERASHERDSDPTIIDSTCVAGQSPVGSGVHAVGSGASGPRLADTG